MKNGLISVIMSTKDTECNVLKLAIESILRQTYKNFEFIIISDGSEKDFRIIKEYKDDRIKILKNEESIGLTKSLNRALKIAKGEYIARMDSDDISLKNRFKVQIAFLEKNKDVDICSTYGIYIGEKKGYKIDIFNKINDKKAELLINNSILHPAAMIRAKFLKENNLEYNESFKYSQDYDLWARSCQITNIDIIPKFCMKYRIHKNQISIIKKNEQRELCKKIYEYNLGKLNINDIEKKVEFLFFLSRKTDKEYSKQEILSFIEEILNLNKKYNVYNEKSLKNVLYYKYYIIKHKEFNFKENIKIILKINFMNMIFKKVVYNLIGRVQNIVN